MWIRSFLLCCTFLVVIGSHAEAQDKGAGKKENKKKVKEIELLHADRFTVDENTPEGASKLIGNVRLKHENALMFCDSAYLYENNSLDAYGHVKIIDGDSLTMTGDSLFYNGDQRMAKVRGNVVIDNKASILKTPFLDYYRETKMAHYYGGGEIDSRKEKIHLTSTSGYYFSDAKLFHFKGDVNMKHPDYTITTDTMHYAPDAEKTWFFGPTNINSDGKHIYCEYGWFDQLADKAQFVRNAKVSSSGQILMGDTIDRDQAAEVGIAKCNVVLVDTNEKFEVHGDYAIYHEQDSTSMVTENMMLMQDMEGDTFFLKADTLFSSIDTAGNRIIRTYYGNRFYKTDMQGACDSLFYHTADSVIYMYTDPILWSDDNQITADSIRITMHNSVIDKLYMDQNAFIIAKEDSIYFNQIKGRNMIGYFVDDELRRVRVEGNGETVYYPREEDNTLIGVNETRCSSMLIRIDSNQIQKISFYEKPTALLTPSDDMSPEGLRLDDFDWRQRERPLSKEDLLMPIGWRETIALDSTLSDSLALEIDTISAKDSVEKEMEPQPDLPSADLKGMMKGRKSSGEPKEEESPDENSEGVKEED